MIYDKIGDGSTPNLKSFVSSNNHEILLTCVYVYQIYLYLMSLCLCIFILETLLIWSKITEKSHTYDHYINL